MKQSDLIPSDDVDQPFSMKPVIASAIHEAVKWALADCCVDPEDQDLEERRAAVILDPYQLTNKELLSMDVRGLAQNIVTRLMGSGGFEVNRVYHGNASVQETVDACFSRPEQDPIADIAMDMGLRKIDH